MSKTNFKCMFLIDDKLYNKAILRDGINENTNIKVSTPNPSSYLTTIPSSRQISNGKPEGSMNAPERLKSSEEINDLDKVDSGQQVNIDLCDKEHQTEIPFASSSSAIIAPLEKSGNNDEMDIDQSMNEKEDCECHEQLPKASSSQKRQFEDVTRKSARSSKKLSTLKPLSAQGKRKRSDEDNNLSDDSDWEELRQRYRRLRGDFDSPPREQGNFDHEEEKTENNIRSNKDTTSTLIDKKKDGQITKFESISYICSICKEIFTKRNALHRHIMNWHAEYFEDSGLQNKRKRSNEDNQKNKKFRSDGRKKRHMPQNQQRQKIARTELPCVFCQRFFKTKYALERHNASIHGVSRGSKRANNGNEARYVKRKKGNDEPAITYLNYF